MVRWITVACQSLCATSRENKELWSGGNLPPEPTNSPNCTQTETSGRIWGTTCPQCQQGHKRLLSEWRGIKWDPACTLDFTLCAIRSSRHLLDFFLIQNRNTSQTAYSRYSFVPQTFKKLFKTHLWILAFVPPCTDCFNVLLFHCCFFYFCMVLS